MKGARVILPGPTDAPLLAPAPREASRMSDPDPSRHDARAILSLA